MKYKWVYLGKAIEQSIEKLTTKFPDIKSKPTYDQLQSRLQKLLQKYNYPTGDDPSHWSVEQMRVNIE
jgi:uncharacterized protein YutD